MNLLLSIIGQRRRAGFDPDAADYFSRIVAAGSTIPEANKSAVNAFIIGCKADGIWSAIKASCILAASDTLAGAIVPLAGPAPTNFNFVAGDYSRTTGLKGDGSTKYLTSGWNNNAETRNNKHLSVWQHSDEDRSTTRSSIGTSNVAGGSSLTTNASARFGRLHANTGGSIANTGNYSGFWGSSRQLADQINMRFNSSNNSIICDSQDPLDAMIDVFRRDSSTWTPARLSFYSIGESLDLALLDARLTTLFSALA